MIQCCGSGMFYPRYRLPKNYRQFVKNVTKLSETRVGDPRSGLAFDLNLEPISLLTYSRGCSKFKCPLAAFKTVQGSKKSQPPRKPIEMADYVLCPYTLIRRVEDISVTVHYQLKPKLQILRQNLQLCKKYRSSHNIHFAAKNLTKKAFIK